MVVLLGTAVAEELAEEVALVQVETKGLVVALQQQILVLVEEAEARIQYQTSLGLAATAAQV